MRSPLSLRGTSQRLKFKQVHKSLWNKGFLCIYWLTGSLPYKVYFIRVLACSNSYLFRKTTFRSSPCHSSTDWCCRKTWQSATRGTWAGLYGQPWYEWGLVGRSGWYAALTKKQLAYVGHQLDLEGELQPTLWNTLLSVLGGRSLTWLKRD